MGELRTRLLVVTTALTALLALSGCAASTAEDPTVSPAPTSAGTSAPSETAASERVDFGPTPSGDGVPTCAALLPAEAVAAVVPSASLVDEVQLPHLAGLQLAAATAGGASCLATNGVAPLDDTRDAKRGDPVFSGITLVVVPDSAPEYREIEQGTGPDGLEPIGPTCAASDAARVYCIDMALAGDAWVYVSATRAQDSADATPEAMTAPFEALVEQAAATVSASAVASVRTDHDVPSDAVTTCSPDNVNTVTSTELVWPLAASDALPSPQEYALAGLGGASCTFDTPATRDRGYSQPRAQYDHVPGGGWIVQQRLSAGTIDRADRLELDGLDDGDAAWRTCDDEACSVDVVSDGGDWEHYVLYRTVAPNTSSAIERWVTAARS